MLLKILIPHTHTHTHTHTQDYGLQYWSVALKLESSTFVVNSWRREFYFYVVGILDACIGPTAKVCPPKQSYVRNVYNLSALCEMLRIKKYYTKIECWGAHIRVLQKTEECETVMRK